MSGLYFDIGRKARDLLYKGYAHQPANHLQGFDCSLDLSCQIRDIVPGLRTLFNFSIPDSAKVELQYLTDYGGIAGGFGLKADPLAGYSPLINFSGLLGSDFLSIGTDLAFDISTRTFNNFNAGLSFNSDFLIASFNLNDKLDTWKASCCCVMDPTTETAIAAELKHTFSVNDTAITIGGQHALFPFTMVKARVDTHGRIGGLIRQELWEKLAITVGGDVDLFDVQGFPKIGLSLAFRL
ncbi:mitochondrial outer membrane protein porin of 36 kDa-like [Corylus avellana]|uniref:mitochondrial outer membrane protein porin of 36 kDa-like n=1 Tax=Corylus avellana TaxID=13451 RepID=UPI001E2341E3|nr:mitochondrial outer membrane protein porin of 36 kDa-like [Corylus avellana]